MRGFNNTGSASAACHAFIRAGAEGMGADCPPGEEDTILDFYNGQILVMRSDAKFPEVLVDFYPSVSPR
jgi:hypothetical protein